MKKLLFAMIFISAASLGWAQSTGSDAKKWEIQAQGGLSFPVSPNFANGYPGYPGYDTGYNFGGAVGYKISPQLSVLLDLEWQDFKNSKYSEPGYFYYWNMTEVSLLLKYRILSGPITPFVFAGPGLVFNSLGYRYTDYYANPGEDYASGFDETDALLEAGVGVEYALTNDFSVFAQTKYTVDFNGGYLTDWTPYGADMPTRYVPVEAGLILNL